MSMTKTVEIMTGVERVQSTVADATTQSAGALDRARELAEQAAAHGWDGVAASMQSAVDAMETVLASLGDADDATGEALAALAEVSDQLSRPEVAQRLAGVVDRLDQARAAADAAANAVDEARQAAEATGGPEQFMGSLQIVSDGLDEACRGLDAVKGTTEPERQEAANWGN
jgi:ABC-type transporter Mla subunit MlaD